MFFLVSLTLASRKNALFLCLTLGCGMFDKFKFWKLFFLLKASHKLHSASTSSSVCSFIIMFYFFSFRFPLPSFNLHECIVEDSRTLGTLSDDYESDESRFFCIVQVSERIFRSQLWAHVEQLKNTHSIAHKLFIHPLLACCLLLQWDTTLYISQVLSLSYRCNVVEEKEERRESSKSSETYQRHQQSFSSYFSSISFRFLLRCWSCRFPT